MKSFVTRATFDPVPASVVRELSRVDAGRGREDFLKSRSESAFEMLANRARVDSSISSSAIEGIHIPTPRAETVLGGTSLPNNRDELELAGYQEALRDAMEFPVTPLTTARLLGWHRRIFANAGPEVAGRLKTSENTVVDRLPSGRIASRFTTVSVAETPMYLSELTQRYELAATGVDHPLLLTAAVTLDFLTIHPFEDGNGRVARILTNALAERHGFGVHRYQSIEKIISNRQDDYYATLAQSTTGWHEAEHSLWPWAEFLVSVFAGAYDSLETLAIPVSPDDQRQAVRKWVKESAPVVFAKRTAVHALPLVSESLILEVLNALRYEGELVLDGKGRGSQWRQIPSREPRS